MKRDRISMCGEGKQEFAHLPAIAQNKRYSIGLSRSTIRRLWSRWHSRVDCLPGGCILEQQGLLERGAENSWLAGDYIDDDPMSSVLGHSITYRVAVGSNAECKVMTLQTLPADDPPLGAEAGQVSGFSLHAGVSARADQLDKLERLCRYISRPAVFEKRLLFTNNGLVRYRLKTPYRDGTTHVFFEPLHFLVRRAALIPKPRVNLTRFHGVFAPNSQWRAQVTPAKRGKRR